MEQSNYLYKFYWKYNDKESFFISEDNNRMIISLIDTDLNNTKYAHLNHKITQTS